ncbi:putative SecA-type protein translocase [Prochlorococcus marinus str. MIT 9313]|uniref:Putative SecA-type protein translocase n=1 Tax=Prochlorococcus marinus (strain MIT 9313) TaxID=74547 RepID=Q7V948_PROMM|nr:putative SecA-type protein translocase [Prochlorococcus marinus str. MIT 9313]
MPHACLVVSEACNRVRVIRLFDVQQIGGMVLHYR